MKSNEKGFGIVIIVLLIVVFGAVGGGGWYVWRSIDKSNETKDSSQDEQFSTGQNTATNDAQFIEITDWGVKIGIGPNLEKVTVSKPTSKVAGRSDVKISIKPSFDRYQDCTSEILITRITDISDFDTPPENKLGDYYYYNSGAGECGGAKESSNNNILTQSELINHFNTLGVKSL